MLFNSGAFLFYFLPLALLGFWLLSRVQNRLVVAWLVLCSLGFYAFWKPAFLLVLVSSLLLNFGISRLISASEGARRSRLLVLGIAVNLAALGYYKYLFPLLGWLNELGMLSTRFDPVILPLGISFFTFTQIAFLIDLSQGEARAETLVDYAFFVTFFPHLIAGPILHHREIMPQVTEKRLQLNADDFSLGLTWFVMGLAKKSVIADTLWGRANELFMAPERASAGLAWVGLLSYSMQLYFDFSGYSDMAIGLARMFSIRFPLNFDSPYKAKNIIEYWQRWHMTLTRYLTLYLHGPIAMAINRRRAARGLKVNKKALATPGGFLAMVALPTLITMFLAGVWHGAGVRFVVFGVLHGAYITLNHAWRTFRSPPSQPPSALRAGLQQAGAVLLTFGCVLLGQIVFRADSLTQAAQVLASLTGAHGLDARQLITPRALFVYALFPVVWFLPNTQQLLGQAEAKRQMDRRWSPFAWKPSLASAVFVGMLLLCASLFITSSATFLYFQF